MSTTPATPGADAKPVTPRLDTSPTGKPQAAAADPAAAVTGPAAVPAAPAKEKKPKKTEAEKAEKLGAKKAKDEEDAERTAQDEQATPAALASAEHQRGDDVALDFGVASAKKVPGKVSGVYLDQDGLTYQVDLQVADPVPMKGNKATVVSITVPAAIVGKPGQK